MMRLSLSRIAKWTKAGVALTVFGLVTALPGRASAQDPAAASSGMPTGSLGQGFGEQGQFVVTSDAFTSFTKTNNSGWTFLLVPGLDYFIAPAITVGGGVALRLDDSDTKYYGVSVRAGFNFNFTEHVSFWARGGFAFDQISAPGGSSSATFLQGSLPICYHVTPHAFLGAGPFYNLNLSGDVSNTYGFSSLVGIWW